MALNGVSPDPVVGFGEAEAGDEGYGYPCGEAVRGGQISKQCARVFG